MSHVSNKGVKIGGFLFFLALCACEGEGGRVIGLAPISQSHSNVPSEAEQVVNQANQAESTLSVVAATEPTVGSGPIDKLQEPLVLKVIALRIETPAPNIVIHEGAFVTFKASVHSSPGAEVVPNQVVWSSDRNGEIGRGMEIRSASLLPGQHVITVTLLDGEKVLGSASAVVQINALPRVSLASPGTSVTIYKCTPLRLEAKADDLEDGPLSGDKFEWTSSIDGKLGNNAAVSVSRLSPGSHIIEVEVGDSVGGRASREIAVTVKDAFVPVVIYSPQDGQVVSVGNSVPLSAEIDDPTKASYPDGAFSWESSLQGPLGVGRALSTKIDMVGTHTITVSVATSCPTFSKKSVTINAQLAAPRNLSVVEGPGRLAVSWDPVYAADSYSLYYDTDGPSPPLTGSGASQGASPITVVGNSLVLTCLKPATTYYITVSAVKGISEGLLGPSIAAQTFGLQELYTIPKPLGAGGFAVAVRNLGDLNGDGRDDIAVGQINTAVRVYSGKDASLLLTVNAPVSNVKFGLTVEKLDDVNGDGVNDFAVGAPWASPGGMVNAGTMYVFSGATGILLYQINGTQPYSYYGEAGIVAAVGDVNGDGRTDLLAGDRDGILYSGADGSLLAAIPVPYEVGHVGFTGAGKVGDVNGDDVPDLLLHEPDASTNGLTYNGYIAVYSGSSLSLLRGIHGTVIYEVLGNVVLVEPLGDLDGDGKGDVLSAATFSSPPPGYVYAWSGATGGQLLIISGEPRPVGQDLIHDFGVYLAGVTDMNGDGKEDILAADPAHDPNSVKNAGSIYMFSGADACLLYRVDGTVQEEQLARFDYADVNNDGWPDLIIGADGGTALPTPDGRVDVYSTQDLGIVPYKVKVPKNGSQTFSGRGGDSPYTFALKVNHSGGSINASTGGYTAGPVGGVKDTIEVADSKGRKFTTQVDVLP